MSKNDPCLFLKELPIADILFGKFGKLFHFSGHDGLGGADLLTGAFHLRRTLFTKRALFHSALNAHLRRAEGAGPQAEHAAHTPLLIYCHGAGVLIFGNGLARAGLFTWRISAMHAGKRDVDTLDFRIMVEGYWPDQETYDIIHDHELYKAAVETEEAGWAGLKSKWYHRFVKVQ